MINRARVRRDVIVVGASAGGISAVTELLARLPADLPAFVGIVIHRSPGSTATWSHVLGMKSALHVVEPKNGDVLTAGVAYVAPADCHMTFAGGHVKLAMGAKEHHTRPAIDPLFTSAAREYGDRVVGVVLTGGGHDGMRGLIDVTDAGGLSLVQTPAEARNPSMPENAIAFDHVLAALSVADIGDAIVTLAHAGTVSASSSVSG